MLEKHLVHMVRNRAAKYGTREVFRFREAGTNHYSSYTWQQFSNLSQKVSQALLSLGFGYGSNIGIFSDNRPEWTIADLGILGIRGVVVPFFSTASQHQVKYIIDETRMELIFVGNNEQLEKALWLMENTSSLKKVVVFGSHETDISDPRCTKWSEFIELDKTSRFEEKVEQLLDQAEADDLATIIYTSGTTGEPKGVMLGHDNFMSCLRIHDARLDVTEKDVSLCFLPLSHIFERSWTFYMLHRGATNVYLDNPKSVIEELPLSKPSLMCTVPRFFEKTYEGILTEESAWPAAKRRVFDWAIQVGHRCNNYRKDNRTAPIGLRIKHHIAEKLVLQKLRSVFGGNIRVMPCSGAAIRTDLLKFFHATGYFVNFGYGATETTATVSCFEKDVFEFESCGTVMPEISVKMNDKGEILVKGATIFKGYYNKPEETAKVLNDGWYATGDRGYFSEAGHLVMEDRINDIFKTSGGKFVSPQKIELLLCQDSFIEQAIVIGDNQKHITALIVPSFPALKSHFAAVYEIKPDHASLVSDTTVNKFFKNRMEKIQSELTPYERVVKFTLLPEPFSIENEALTSTLKIRRKVIIEKYRQLVDTMYSS
jgi:long-chain acyl-CoA synthetase